MCDLSLNAATMSCASKKHEGPIKFSTFEQGVISTEQHFLLRAIICILSANVGGLTFEKIRSAGKGMDSSEETC